MCSTVKHNGRSFNINARQARLPFKGRDGIVEAPWKGYARKEKLKEYWLGAFGILVRIPADQYKEQGYTFKVPAGKAILGVVLKQPRFERPAGSVLVVTRPAETKEERRVHPRHPLFVDAA